MNVSFNGFDNSALTFKCGGKIEKHYPVKISDNSTVAICGEGDSFIGFCLDSDNENATIQMSGYVKMKYSDTAPELGKNALVAADDGTVKENSGGTVCTVLSVNTAETTVEFLF